MSNVKSSGIKRKINNITTNQRANLENEKSNVINTNENANEAANENTNSNVYYKNENANSNVYYKNENSNVTNTNANISGVNSNSVSKRSYLKTLAYHFIFNKHNFE